MTPNRPTEVVDDRLYLVCPCGARLLVAQRCFYEWKPLDLFTDRSSPWFTMHSTCLDKLT